MESSGGWKTIEGVRYPWKGMECTGSILDSWFVPGYWWMTELLYASCLLSRLIDVSLPFVYTWFYSSFLCYTSLLTLRLLIAYWAWLMVCYYTLVGVLISCSRVAGSSPAWHLVFYRRSTRAYSRALIPHHPVWLFILHLCRCYSTSLAPLFS